MSAVLDVQLFLEVFVTLFVIMDPPGTVPVFLALTGTMTGRQRRAAARQAIAAAFGVIVVFALFGQQVLDYMNISLPALQASGGLLLLLVAMELLTGRMEEPKPAEHNSVNVALVPLGTPLLAGPGAIAATMLYMRQADDVGSALSVVAALLAVLAVVYLVLRYSVLLGRLLKDNGIHLISRVMGLLLAAIAVQLVASGIAEWIRTGVS